MKTDTSGSRGLITWTALLGSLAILAAGCDSGDATASPDAPSKLTAAPLGGGVHLTWKDTSSQEEAFEIERKEGSGAFAKLDSVPFDMTLYHDAAVSLGNAYTYRVRAKLPTGYSGYSNEAQVFLSAGSDGGTAGSGGGGGGGDTGGAGGSEGAGGSGGTGGSGGSGKADAGRDSAADTRQPDGAAAAISFRKDVIPLLNATCGSATVGCHNRDMAVGRSMPQFGPCKVIWLSTEDASLGSMFYSGPGQGEPTGCPDDGGLYARLTQLHSMLCDAFSWDRRPVYIVPRDLKKSLLYQVIAGDPSMGGTCTINGGPVGLMPKKAPDVPATEPLPAAQIAVIRDWIMQGAPNN